MWWPPFLCFLLVSAPLVSNASSSFSVPLFFNDAAEQGYLTRMLQLRRKSHRGLRSTRAAVRAVLAADIPLQDQVLPGRKLATYYGKIGLGDNPTSEFRVLFDTGSCELWIPDSQCQSAQCNDHAKYTRSSSFRDVDGDSLPSGREIEVEYLSGTLQGYQGLETVVLSSDIKAANQTVDFATSLDIPLLKDMAWDGIVGLGFSNQEQRQRGITPLLETLRQQGALSHVGMPNQLAYYLNATGGMLTFGKTHNDLLASPEEGFVWAPVDPSNSYWTIQVVGIRKAKNGQYSFRGGRNDDGHFHDGGKSSIIDSGTYLIYAPRETMDGFLRDVRLDSCEDKSRLPDIMLQIRGLDSVGNHTQSGESPPVVELILTPDDYVLEFQSKQGSHCLLGIAADDAADEDQLGGWTLGQVFLRTFYTVFDWENMKIGFARAK